MPDRIIQLTRKEYAELERALQWPEALERWGKVNTPTTLPDVFAGVAPAKEKS